MNILSRNNSQVVQVPDIVKKLESASSEIERLTKAIEENNIFFEEKLREYSQAHSEFIAALCICQPC